MSLTPAFDIGIWNAWVLWALQMISMIVPTLFMSDEAKSRAKRAAQFMPFSDMKTKIVALSTHLVIMPFSIIYSIFLPLQLGAFWFYAGLAVFLAAATLNFLATKSFADTPVDQPVTGGVYRISRHPIYLSGFLLNLSIGIACASWVMVLCAILWIALWQMAVPAEERLLIGQFGDAYRAYVTRTPRWIGIAK